MRLFLCEKPSQARDIAQVLGAHQRAAGCLTGKDVTVTWCIGHLLEAAAPDSYGEHYKRWSLEHLPILPTSWQWQVKSETAGQFKIIQRLLRQADEVVIATDADREGELIAREILESCRYRRPTHRLWLSALNETSIRKALGSLKPGSETLPLYHAALARARADWLVGMNLSRLFTLLAQRAGHKGVLSVGRVQTPTLHLVVQRDREIAAFKPVAYWVIDVSLQPSAVTFKAHWLSPPESADEAGRCIREAAAREALAQLHRARRARVASVDTQRVCEPPALPFDLSTLQESCSRQFGLEVQQTLNIAQALYERHKAITYPRSDCRYLPESMHAEAPALLTALVAAEPTLKHLGFNPQRRSRAWNDHKVTAHHAIVPTAQRPDQRTLSHEERQVYELIRAHYLAQFLPDHAYERTRVLLQCREVTLEARGKSVIEAGWRTVLVDQRIPEDSDVDSPAEQSLPILTVGTECVVREANLWALKTTPPGRFTQGELIKAMKGIARWVTDTQLKQKLKETTGIGTEATRAGIINGLIARGYLVKERRSVRASDIAHELIQAIPAAIADPGTTALWEQSLDRIAAGHLGLEEFVQQQSAWVAALVRAHAHAAHESPTPMISPEIHPDTSRPRGSIRRPAKPSRRTRGQ